MTKRDLYLEMGQMPMGDHASQPHPQAGRFQVPGGEEIPRPGVEGLQADGGVSAWYSAALYGHGEPWRNDCHDPRPLSS